MKILILCTGNSCRSQMAEGFLKSFDDRHEIYSAGTQPALSVHPKAIQVMDEVGIDIASNYPKSVDEFLYQNFDFVITVCDDARDACPFFSGKVRYQLHIGFEDPARATGTDKEILEVFRKVRDGIREEIYKFYLYYIK
jgi:arsenate reductase (thioredoxin)